MKILVGFDGSNVSKEAISLAERHAATLKADLIIAHSMAGGPEVPRRDFEIAENNLEHEKNRLLDKNIQCESILSVRGLQPGEDLVKLAEENNVDEIIIGVRRRSKVGKLLFGSTAQYVILTAHCPVISVK